MRKIRETQLSHYILGQSAYVNFQKKKKEVKVWRVEMDLLKYELWAWPGTKAQVKREKWALTSGAHASFHGFGFLPLGEIVSPLPPFPQKEDGSACTAPLFASHGRVRAAPEEAEALRAPTGAAVHASAPAPPAPAPAPAAAAAPSPSSPRPPRRRGASAACAPLACGAAVPGGHRREEEEQGSDSGRVRGLQAD